MLVRHLETAEPKNRFALDMGFYIVFLGLTVIWMIPAIRNLTAFTENNHNILTAQKPFYHGSSAINLILSLLASVACFGFAEKTADLKIHLKNLGTFCIAQGLIIALMTFNHSLYTWHAWETRESGLTEFVGYLSGSTLIIGGIGWFLIVSFCERWWQWYEHEIVGGILGAPSLKS